MKTPLTDDLEFFIETTRRFLDDVASPPALRSHRADPRGSDAMYWQRGAQLGWTSLLVDESDGGGTISGDGIVDLVAIAHEFGRHAAPGPLAATAVVAGALSRRGSLDQKRDLLPGILDGTVIAPWAYLEPSMAEGLGPCTSQLTRSPSGGYTLTGIKGPVDQASDATVFLTDALLDGELTELLVPADVGRVTVSPMSSVDLTRRFGQVRFDEVPIPETWVLGAPGRAAGDVELKLRQLLAVQLAEMVGAMERSFELTVEWAFDRYSFGRPLASYQELKHRFADMKMWLEASHALADASTQAVATVAPDTAELLSAAKAYVGHFGRELCQDCVQIHGGIGVTFEHDLHLFLRRVTLNSTLFGTPRHHRLALADLLDERTNA